MKYLIILALISLTISRADIDDLIIKVKQNIAKQVKDLPADIDKLIRYVGGYTNAFKTKVMYNQLQNYLSREVFPNKVYHNCLESTFKGNTYYDAPDYILGNRNVYTLNYYIAACQKVDNNNVNLVGIKGKYYGTISEMIKEKVPVCKKIFFRNKCFAVEKTRKMNGSEYNRVRDILKTKYIQDALDKLNRLR